MITIMTFNLPETDRSKYCTDSSRYIAKQGSHWPSICLIPRFEHKRALILCATRPFLNQSTKHWLECGWGFSKCIFACHYLSSRNLQLKDTTFYHYLGATLPYTASVSTLLELLYTLPFGSPPKVSMYLFTSWYTNKYWSWKTVTKLTSKNII